MGRQSTAEEHAYTVEQEFAAQFTSQQVLVQHYLNDNKNKLGNLGFVIKVAHDHQATRILSLGAGQCVLEWFLQMAIADPGFVFATDFDAYFVRKASELFPELKTSTFDFARDNVEEFVAQCEVPLDLAVFFGSAYVMDDATFINIFAPLREAGIPRIIDFHADATTLRRMCINATLGYLASKPAVRRLAHKPAYRGKFHGYERNIRAIRKLYAAADWQISEEHTPRIPIHGGIASEVKRFWIAIGSQSAAPTTIASTLAQCSHCPKWLTRTNSPPLLPHTRAF